MTLGEDAKEPSVKQHYLKIAETYLRLAEAEEELAERLKRKLDS